MRKFLPLSFFLCLSAYAGNAELTWKPPTHNCDGSPIAAPGEELDFYTVYYGKRTEVVDSTTQTDYWLNLQKLEPGNWWFSVSVTDSAGEESQFVTVTKTVADAEFVTTGTVVYTFVKGENGIIVLPVGTVALGVVCDATQSVNGKNVIPRSEVTWSGLTRPKVVIADCG